MYTTNNYICLFVTAAVMCSFLTAPTNGVITYTGMTSGSLGFMDIATYSCNSGYGLSGGNTVRTCTGSAGSSGEWTGTAPTCEGMQLIGVKLLY